MSYMVRRADDRAVMPEILAVLTDVPVFLAKSSGLPAVPYL
jgi:hypothetical protein